jgi:hypothetical protein
MECLPIGIGKSATFALHLELRQLYLRPCPLGFVLQLPLYAIYFISFFARLCMVSSETSAAIASLIGAYFSWKGHGWLWSHCFSPKPQPQKSVSPSIDTISSIRVSSALAGSKENPPFFPFCDRTKPFLAKRCKIFAVKNCGASISFVISSHPFNEGSKV